MQLCWTRPCTMRAPPFAPGSSASTQSLATTARAAGARTQASGRSKPASMLERAAARAFPEMTGSFASGPSASRGSPARFQATTPGQRRPVRRQRPRAPPARTHASARWPLASRVGSAATRSCAGPRRALLLVPASLLRRIAGLEPTRGTGRCSISASSARSRSAKSLPRGCSRPEGALPGLAALNQAPRALPSATDNSARTLPPGRQRRGATFASVTPTGRRLRIPSSARSKLARLPSPGRSATRGFGKLCCRCVRINSPEPCALLMPLGICGTRCPSSRHSQTSSGRRIPVRASTRDWQANPASPWRECGGSHSS